MPRLGRGLRQPVIFHAGSSEALVLKQGTATGSHAWAGSATGATVYQGSATGAWALAGTASGSAPTTGNNIGSDQFKALATSTTLTVDTACDVDDVVLLRFVADNIGAFNGQTNTHLSVIDARGNTWTKLWEQNRAVNPAAGVCASVWQSKLTTALEIGDSLTVTHEGVEARTIAAEKYSGATGTFVAKGGGQSGSTPSYSLLGLDSSKSYDLYAVLGVEHSTAEPSVNDPDYSSGTVIGTSGGSATTNISQRVSTRDGVTGITEDTYSVTLSGTTDYVLIIVGVELEPAASGGIPTVNLQDTGDDTGATSITADWFEPTVAGEYLLALAGVDADGVGSPSINPASSDWTQLASDLNVGNCLVRAFGIANAAERTGTETFFIVDSAESGQDTVVALFRLEQVEDIDSVVSDQGADSSTGMDAGDIVTGEPNQLLVYVGTHEGESGTVTGPLNSFDEHVNITTALRGTTEDQVTLYVATKVAPTATTYSGANYSTTVVEEWSALLLSFFSSGQATARAVAASAPAVASLTRTIAPARDLPTDAPAAATLERTSGSVREMALSAPAVALLERSTLPPASETWRSGYLWRGGQTWRGTLEVPTEFERDIATTAPANAVLTRSGASHVREIAETAGATASLASIVPGIDPGVVVPLVHRFISVDGSVERVLPDTDPLTSLVDGFTCTERAPGGYDAATAQVPHAELTASPTAFEYGAQWKVERDSTVIWAGTLTDPDESGPAVVLKGLGTAVEAEKNFERRMWLSTDTDWSISDADPFDYDTDTGKIEAEVQGREFRFKVPRNTNFTLRSTGVVGGILQPGNDASGIEQDEGGNDQAYWATALVKWFPTVNVRGQSFDVFCPDGASEHYKLQVVAAHGLNDPLEVMGTYALDNAALSNRRREVDCDIPSGYELVGIRLKRRSLKRKARRYRVRCRNIKTRGLASDDNYKTHEVVLDLAQRVAPTWSIAGVQTSSTNVGPLDTQGVSAAEILDDLGFLDDWRWLALDEAWEWGPWDTRTYNLIEGRFPRALIPTDRFNAVEVPFRYGGGYISSKTVVADPNPMGLPLRVYRLELDRPPNEAVATVFAQVIANYLSQVRYAGTAEFTWVEPSDLEGIQFDGWQVHAGDTLVVDGTPLRIESMSKGDTSVQATFGDGHPLLDKLLARRTKALNLGKSNAEATLGGLGLDIPKTPTNVVGAFEEVETKGGGRRFDGLLDWDEVIEDILDQSTVIDRYIVEWRYELPDGTKRGRDQVVIKAQGDDDDPNDPIPTQGRVRDLAHPHKWKTEMQVTAVDALGRPSVPSGWTPAKKPAAFGPRAPQSVTLELNRKKLELEYDIIEPGEQDSDGEPSLDRTFNHVRIKRFRKIGSGPWEQVGKTIRTRATSKTWPVRKPRGKAFKCELWSVDDYGNTSSVVTTDAVRKAAPNAPTVRSRRRHPRRIEWRLDPPTARTDGTSDDFDETEVEAYDYTVLQNGVVDENRSDHFRKALTYSIEIPKGSTGWKLRRKSIGVDGDDSSVSDESTTVDDETVTIDFPDIGGSISLPQMGTLGISRFGSTTAMNAAVAKDGDIWINTSFAPSRVYRRISGSWEYQISGNVLQVGTVIADAIVVGALDFYQANGVILNAAQITGGRIAGTLFTTSLSGTGSRIELGGNEPDRIRVFGNVQRGYFHADSADVVLQLLNSSTFHVKGGRLKMELAPIFVQTSGDASNGSGTNTPAQVKGFFNAVVSGVDVRIPYYPTA